MNLFFLATLVSPFANPFVSSPDESVQVPFLASGDTLNGQGGCTEVTLLPELRASRHRQQQQGRIP